MGVEIAAQRDLKRRLQILSDENNELKVKLEVIYLWKVWFKLRLFILYLLTFPLI